MKDMQPVPDPYLLLGVPRGASIVQVKAAHRALAKRYHPDAPEGDTIRFLAVQDAYGLLSDPVRRREWDARHAPGPVRAGDGPTRGRRGASGRWTREEPEMGTRRGPRSRRAADASAAGDASRPPGAQPPPRASHGSDTRSGSRSASGRDPAARGYTWSAEGVPWWDEAPSRGAAGGGEPSDAGSGSSRRPGAEPGRSGPSHAESGSSAPAGAEPRPATPGSAPGSRGINDFDVYTRSSGAAWSSAARRYFREADSDLPHRGVFRRQGTQYVTGARARQAAESEARRSEDAITRIRPVAPPPRQAFDHDPGSAARRTAWTSARPADASTAASSPRPTPERRGRSVAAGAHDLPRRIAEVTLAWAPLAAGIGYGVPLSTGCGAGGSGCEGLLVPAQAALAATLLGALIVFPRLTRIAALAATGALAVAIPLVVAAATLGLVPPAPPIAAAGVAAIGVGYGIGGLLGAFGVLRQERARPRDPGARMRDG